MGEHKSRTLTFVDRSKCGDRPVRDEPRARRVVAPVHDLDKTPGTTWPFDNGRSVGEALDRRRRAYESEVETFYAGPGRQHVTHMDSGRLPILHRATAFFEDHGQSQARDLPSGCPGRGYNKSPGMLGVLPCCCQIPGVVSRDRHKTIAQTFDQSCCDAIDLGSGGGDYEDRPVRHEKRIQILDPPEVLPARDHHGKRRFVLFERTPDKRPQEAGGGIGERERRCLALCFGKVWRSRPLQEHR
jgi:hypothetical protein